MEDGLVEVANIVAEMVSSGAEVLDKAGEVTNFGYAWNDDTETVYFHMNGRNYEMTVKESEK